MIEKSVVVAEEDGCSLDNEMLSCIVINFSTFSVLFIVYNIFNVTLNIFIFIKYSTKYWNNGEENWCLLL